MSLHRRSTTHSSSGNNSLLQLAQENIRQHLNQNQHYPSSTSSIATALQSQDQITTTTIGVRRTREQRDLHPTRRVVPITFNASESNTKQSTVARAPLSEHDDDAAANCNKSVGASNNDTDGAIKQESTSHHSTNENLLLYMLPPCSSIHNKNNTRNSNNSNNSSNSCYADLTPGAASRANLHAQFERVACSSEKLDSATARRQNLHQIHFHRGQQQKPQQVHGRHLGDDDDDAHDAVLGTRRFPTQAAAAATENKQAEEEENDSDDDEEETNMTSVIRGSIVLEQAWADELVALSSKPSAKNKNQNNNIHSSHHQISNQPKPAAVTTAASTSSSSSFAENVSFSVPFAEKNDDDNSAPGPEDQFQALLRLIHVMQCWHTKPSHTNM